MQPIPTGAPSPEREDFPRRRITPCLDAIPAEAVKGRILNSAQASQYWGVSLPHWRRLYRAGKVPSPIRIGVRKCEWRLDDLIDALAERAREEA
jgi:predicted DNA-binding transcriptional regulator AlpA